MTAHFGEQPRPRSFAEAYQECHDAYTHELRTVVQEHNVCVSGIAPRYDAQVALFLEDHPQALPFDAMQRNPVLEVTNNTAATTQAAARVFAAAASFIDILPEHDQSVWQRVQSTVTSSAYSAAQREQVITMQLSSASSEEARQAMRAALDESIWQRVQSTVTSSAYSAAQREQVITMQLSSASSEEARQAMRKQLANNSRQQSARQENRSSGPYEAFNAEDFLRGMFNRAYATYQQNQTPRQEAPKQLTKEQEARAIVARVTREHRDAGWLKSTEIIEVRRVIDTVRRLRANAQEEGEAVDDKKIYLIYRKKIETAEDPETAARLTKSFNILSAMMGGAMNGELPF